MKRPCIVTLLLAATVYGCAASHASFRPTERVEGRTVEGFREAFYDLSIANERNAELKIWSRGAFLVDTATGKRTVIRVGFTIDNGGEVPIQLEVDSVRLESLQTDEPQQEDLSGRLVVGEAVVAPGTSGDTEVEFTLPATIRPADVKAFRIKWSARAAGKTFTEFTPFVQHSERYAYIPVYAYYYPYHPWHHPFYTPFYYRYPGRQVIIVQPYPRRMIVRGHPRSPRPSRKPQRPPSPKNN